MFGKNKIRGILAQSVYEDLTAEDQRTLDEALKRDAHLAGEAEAFRALAKTVPAEKVMLERDLMPLLRVRLNGAAAAPRRLHLRYAYGAIGAACAAMLVLYVAGFRLTRPADAPATDTPIAQNSAASVLESDIAEAKVLVADVRAGDAYKLLTASLETAPSDPHAGEAQLLLGDIAFAELRMYPAAFDHYATLRAKYSDTFASHPEAFERLDLLDESRPENYASLYALDAARLQSDFASLEGVVGKFPGTYVASLAAEDMARLSSDGAPEGADRMVYAMETALKRCVDVVAASQLKIELGHLYREVQNNPERARAMFEDVAATGAPVLAKAAQDELEKLPAN